MRWYNPKLEDFEWREVPQTDEGALSLLEGFPDCERYAGIYREWRNLGAPITDSELPSMALTGSWRIAHSTGPERPARAGGDAYAVGVLCARTRGGKPWAGLGDRTGAMHSVNEGKKRKGRGTATRLRESPRPRRGC